LDYGGARDIYCIYQPFKEEREKKRQIKFNVQGYRSPQDGKLPFEEHFITTKDKIQIHSWLITQDEKSICPTIIFFHGNAGNIGFCLPNAKTLYYTTACNILMVEYRGYGNSAGIPSEKGLILDGQAAIDFLRSRNDIDHKKIFLFGRSLGGAVAIHLALLNQDKLCGIMVENTFLSIDEMVVVILVRLGCHRFLTAIRFFLKIYLSVLIDTIVLGNLIIVEILQIFWTNIRYLNG